MNKLRKWWSAFVAANQGPGPQSAPGYNFFPVRPVRTEGAGGMAFQVLTELPYMDASGPTVANSRHILFAEGATLPAIDPTLVVAGSIQGVPNIDQLGLNGLLDPYESMISQTPAG